MSRTAPDAVEIEALAREAVAGLPAAVRRELGGVAVLVEEFPDPETEAEMALESPYELTGLYRGVPLSEKSVLDQPMAPDTILLYRQPLLLEWCESGVDLGDLIRHVVIHEVGHHVGLSDAEMEAIEAAAGGAA